MIKLVSLNTSYQHTMLAPYYLRANSGDIKERMEIITLSTKVSIEDIVTAIEPGNSDIVSFSCYIFNINHVRAVATMLKEINSNIIIVYGGPEIEDVGVAVYSEADYIIIGEGEVSFPTLMRAIIAGKKSPRVIHSQLPLLDSIVSPYDDYIHDIDGKIAYFESSRGCPYNCAYCMSGKSRLRNFPLQYVYDNINKFKGANIKVLKFVDRTFNADKARAVELLQYIVSNAAEFRFTFHFEIAADIISQDFLNVVESASKGLFQFEIGVQSFNIDTLAAVIRKCDIGKVKANIMQLTSYGNCHIHTDLIAGLPYEGLDSFRDSFDMLYSLGGDMLQVGTLKLLHGSRLEEMVSGDSGYQFNESAPYEVICTPYMSQSDIEGIKRLDKVVDKYHNSGTFKRTLAYFVRDSYYDFYSGLAAFYDVYERDTPIFDRLYDYLVSLGHDKDIVQAYLVADYMIKNHSLPKSGRLANDYDTAFKLMLQNYQYDNKSAYEFLLHYDPFSDTRRQIIIVGYNQFAPNFEWIIIEV